MNEFVSLLNDYIENSGISQSQISREVDIGRTKLNKCLNGKRNLTYQELEKICNYLGLSNYQESLLKEAYANRDLTRMQLANFKELENLFRNICDVNKIDRNQLVIHPVNRMAFTHSHYFGRLNVITMIKKIVRSHYDQQSKVDLVMNLPLYDNLLRQFFIEILCNFNSNFQINHLVPVNLDDSLVNENLNVLNVLNQVLPLAMLGQYRYNCLYFDAYLLKNEFNIYPYFIIVNDTAMFVSNDLKNMRIETDIEAVRYYMKVIELQKLSSKPLVTLTSDVPEGIYDFVFSDDAKLMEKYSARKIYSISELDNHFCEKFKRARTGVNDDGNISVLVRDDMIVIKPAVDRSDCLIIENRTLIKNVKDYVRANIPNNF